MSGTGQVPPNPLYPNVTPGPGVPSIFSQVGNAQNEAVLVTSDALSIVKLFFPPQWGLFTDDGSPAFSAFGLGGGPLAAASSTVLGAVGAGGISVVEVEYRKDHRISSAQQEQGSFLSYDKVEMPFDARISYAVSGAALLGTLSNFLAQALAYQQALTMFSFIMPEMTYPSCNIVHHDFKRTARSGATMVIVDIWVEEVRITGTSQFSNTTTQNPASANPSSGGSPQPTSVPAASPSAPPTTTATTTSPGLV